MATWNTIERNARAVNKALKSNCTRVYFRLGGSGFGLRVTHAKTVKGELRVLVVGHGWTTPYITDTIEAQ